MELAKKKKKKMPTQTADKCKEDDDATCMHCIIVHFNTKHIFIYIYIYICICIYIYFCLYYGDIDMKKDINI